MLGPGLGFAVFLPPCPASSRGRGASLPACLPAGAPRAAQSAGHAGALSQMWVRPSSPRWLEGTRLPPASPEEFRSSRLRAANALLQPQS